MVANDAGDDAQALRNAISGTYGLETQNVTGAASGGLLNPNNRFTFNRGSGNSGW